MANEVEIRVTADASKAERGLKGMGNSLSRLSRQAKIAGTALTGVAAGGVFFMKSMSEAALVQDQAMALFMNSAKNVGTQMGGLEEKVNAVTAALQNKTNFGDEEQLAVLAKMIPVLGSTEEALAALPIIMDAAATTGRGLREQSETLTKAFAGTVNQAESLGIVFDETATTAERMAQTAELVAGAAEASADPFKQMSNAIGDAKETIGAQFLPVMRPLVKNIQSLAEKFSALSPKTQETIGKIVMATVAFAAIGGPILLLLGFLPTIALGFGIVTAAMGPITIGLGIIAGAIALGILAWKNWDKIVEFVRGRLNKQFGWLFPGGKLPESIKELKNLWNNTWQSMKDWFFKIGRWITGKIEDIANGFIGMVNKIIDAAQKIGLMKDVAKLEEFELSFDDMVESVGSKAIEMADKAKEGLTKVVEEVKTFTTDAVEDIKEATTEGLDFLLEKAGLTAKALGEFNLTPGGIEEGLVGGMLAPGAPGAPGAPTVPGGPTDPTAPGAAGGRGISGPRSGIQHFAREGGVTTLTTKAGVVTDAFSAIPQLEAQRGAGAKFLKASFDPVGTEQQIADFHKKQANWARNQESALIEIAAMSNPTNRRKALTQFLNDVGGKSNIDSRLGKLFNRASSSDSNPTRSFGKGLSGKDTRLALEAMHHVQEAANRKWISENYMPIDKLGASLSGDVDWWAMRGLAKGGVVTRPTMALIGEAGPEAVIPLGKGGGMAPTINVTISGNTVFGEMDFKRLVVKAVTDSHRRGGLPFLGRA